MIHAMLFAYGGICMSWTVSVNNPFYVYSQNSEPVWGNYTDTVLNTTLNCGETATSMVVKHLRDVYVAPSAIKDVMLRDKGTGTTTEHMIGSFLSKYCNVGVTLYYPITETSPDNTGLLNIEYKYLYNNQPLIVLGTLVINGTNYNHWRVVTQQTETSVTMADPWTGSLITQTYGQHWGNFRGILIGIEASRPSDL